MQNANADKKFAHHGVGQLKIILFRKYFWQILLHLCHLDQKTSNKNTFNYMKTNINAQK